MDHLLYICIQVSNRCLLHLNEVAMCMHINAFSMCGSEDRLQQSAGDVYAHMCVHIVEGALPIRQNYWEGGWLPLTSAAATGTDCAPHLLG